MLVHAQALSATLMEKRNEEEDRGEKDDLRMRGWLVVEETWRKIERLRPFWINFSPR